MDAPPAHTMKPMTQIKHISTIKYFEGKFIIIMPVCGVCAEGTALLKHLHHAYASVIIVCQ